MWLLCFSVPLSESLLTAVEATPEFFGKWMFESGGVRGRVGQTMWPVLHSSGMLPLRHCNDGKQFTMSVDGESMVYVVDIKSLSVFWMIKSCLLCL